MKRIQIVAESQPIDPVDDGVLLVDGMPAEMRPSHPERSSSRFESLTTSREGRRHGVNVTVLKKKWTVDVLADYIARDVFEAADRAGLEVDSVVVKELARKTARRHVGPFRWLGWLRR